MSNRDQSVPMEVALVADLMDGYVTNSLNQSPLQASFQTVLSELDPTQAISRRMLRAFKRRVNRTSRLEDLQGRQLMGLNWGALRNADEEVIEGILRAPAISLLRDDVGPIVEPVFPDGTRFTITYTGLFCRKRTGDRGIFGPSDEPYVITSAVAVDNGNNVVRTERHPVGDPDRRYGGVDSKESREGPVAACWSGSITEVSLVVTPMENDEGDPDAYKEEIDLLVNLAAQAAAAFGVPIPDQVKKLVSKLVNWIIDSEDDSIGTETMILTPYDLKLAAAASTLTFRDGSVQTTIPYHRSTFHDEDGEYFVLFRIDADQEPVTPAVPGDFLSLGNAAIDPSRMRVVFF